MAYSRSFTFPILPGFLLYYLRFSINWFLPQLGHLLVSTNLSIMTYHWDKPQRSVKNFFTPFTRTSKQQTCNSLLDIFTAIDKWSYTLCYCLKSIRSACESVELFLFKRIQWCSRAAARAFCIDLNANHAEVWLPDTNTHTITVLRRKQDDQIVAKQSSFVTEHGTDSQLLQLYSFPLTLNTLPCHFFVQLSWWNIFPSQ